MLSLPTLLALLVPFGAGEHLRLAPDRDNTLYQSPTGSLSNGAGERLFAGVTDAGQARRALLHFDLSAIPAAARVTRVTLRLNVSKVPLLPPPTTFAVHRMTRAWGEGASDALGEEGGGAPSAPGDATWLHAFHPTDLWAAVGGDYDPAPSAVAIAGIGLGPVTWSGPGLEADVQAWVSGALANHGWLIKDVDETTPKSAKRFDSREYAGAVADRPWLLVEYELGLEPCGRTVYCDEHPANVATVAVDGCGCDAGGIAVLLAGAPPAQFTYLLVGAGDGAITDPPGAAGELCLGGAPIGRYFLDAGLTDATGSFRTDVLNSVTGGGGGALPDSLGNLCAPPGQTWNFQYWYRGGGPSGFSQALSVTFR